MHENLCKVHLEFFDTYLKGLKNEPDIRSNDVITAEKINADMQSEKRRSVWIIQTLKVLV